ncbi:MAG: Soluble pyridine nucleotide transhydrogenase [Gemmatimonadetes bacterium]|nr:Soluble pyridine nucleotide transhydrogenase [Gemmatimonadota bacterium]
MSEHFDLVVIGAGPAGEKGAAQAAYFGKRVCVIERAPRPGGAAINTGTVPSKTLRETALYFSGLRQRGLYGVDYHVKPDITIADFMFRERAVVDAEWKLIDDNFKRHDVTQYQGAATFVDARTVEVTRYGEKPRRITGGAFLVATGSHPQQPSGVAVDGSVIVDSDTLLTLDRIPASMIVVGGGVVGCEYACIFAALGVRVTIVTSRARLLAHLDADVCDALRQQMTGRLGVSVLLDTDVASIAVESSRAVVRLGSGDELSADCALYCAGRIGASAGLGLDTIGVRTNSRGFVVVDQHYRTDIPWIYAAGDVIGFPALASTSMEQARVAICHAFDLRYKQAVANVIPYGVYTIPEVATVGMTEEQLAYKRIDFEIGRASFRGNARGQIIGDVEGFVKLLFSPADQRLLGVSIVGEGAAELIHIGMACLTYGGTIDFFIQSVFNYPSLSDAYKYAAYDGLQALAKRHAKHSSLPPSGSYRSVPS